MVKVEVSIEVEKNGHILFGVDRLVREDWNEKELKLATAVTERIDDILQKAVKKTKGLKLVVTRLETGDSRLGEKTP